MTRPLPSGAVAASYSILQGEQWRHVEGAIIAEEAICIHVNGQELATVMATPVDQKAMAVGFLMAEGFIGGMQDIAVLDLSHGGTCVDIWLDRAFVKPERVIKTSGCGGGVTFDDLTAERPPLPPSEPVTPEQIAGRYRDLRSYESLYPVTRGVHASALCTPDEILLAAEDVGRHNTLDKLWGKALQQGIATQGRMIITTGRVSSEMLGKAAKMGVPLIASRTSPTSRSVALARAWDITIVGYLRRDSLRVYSTPERIAAPAPLGQSAPTA